MPLDAGVRVGRYEIQSHLGSGGMGDVYRARDETLGRDVALKLLPPDVAGDTDRLRRFEQEARSASALNHPGIVSIYELGEAQGRPFISMELVDGQTLRQLLESGQPLPLRRALQIGAQLADALAKAHAAGLVHRDLKPENLMLSGDGFAKILDFGLAKLVDDSARRDDDPTTTNLGTQSGAIVGTVGYMSPEQASGRPADPRSDQFAFGLVLYEMLTGRRPFARATMAETLSAIIRDDAPPLTTPTASVPAPVRWIVERCLEKRQDDRYDSTRDLARDLARVRDGLGDLTAGPQNEPLSRRGRRREMIAWCAAAVFGGLALVAGLGRLGSPGTAAPPIRLALSPPPDGTFYLAVGSLPFAVSPDGHTIAAAISVDGQRSIWTRPLDSLDWKPVPGSEGGSGPFWSPDGQWIGYFGDQKLKKIAVGGGDAITLCDARGGGGASWSPSGTIVFAAGVDGPLSSVPEDGGVPQDVTALDPAHDESLHAAPVFLADGRHFVFMVLGSDNYGIHVGSIDGSDHRLLLPGADTPARTGDDEILFVRGRTLYAQRLDPQSLELQGDAVAVAEGIGNAGPSSAAAAAGGTVVFWGGNRDLSQLTWMRRDGTVISTVGPPGVYMGVALSPTGDQIAVDRFDDEPAIWIIDAARGVPTRATFGSLYESTPVWSPDGRAFAFASAVDAPPNLFLKRLQGGDVERLTTSVFQSFPQSWSAAAEAIVYVTIEPGTGHDIWMLPMSGSGTPVPVLRSPFFESYPRVSPNGRWLAYVSNESDEQAIFVTSFPEPGDTVRVSAGAAGFPVWRPDGRELYFRRRDGWLVAVPVSADGETFEPGTPQPLFQPPAIPGLLGIGTFYAVAADGRFLVNAFVERLNPPATAIANWSVPGTNQ